MVLRFLPVLWTCWRGPDRVFMGLRTGPAGHAGLRTPGSGTRADGGFAAPCSRGNIPRKQPHGTATFGEAIMVLRFLPVL